MGRPERPLDPAAGPVQRLAHQLRELRRSAGNPSYRTMAAATGVSATTLSRAASGERLPSLDALRGYVRGCGGDPGEWEPRWEEAEAAVAETVRPQTADESPPYRGLARFEPGDRHLFFGRDRMAEELTALVHDRRLVMLFGASGSGKSSLLRAGLIPRLRERTAADGESGPAVLRILTPGPRPAATYGHLLAPARGEPESWVVVDQFEEVFTLCRDQTERARFIDLLLAARAPDSRLRVLIAVRADFYARCVEHRGLADVLHGAGLALGPMTADELRESVVKPAAANGLLVERELTARIVEEVLDEPGGLPMLSHALLETWRRRRSRMLTLAAYEAAGGVRGAIAATAEEAYGQLSPARARAARQLLLRMVEPGRDTPDTRRPLTRTELDEWADPDVSAVVERLARARLLTSDEDGVQLAHEALLTCWPRLAAWLEEEREHLRHHRRLTEAAHAWVETDRDPGALYRGTRLDRAQELFTSDGSLTATERDFLTAASQARDAERRTAARTARRSRLLLTSLSAVLVVALFAGLAAWTQHRTNDRQKTDAAARRVAATADSLTSTDPRTAMLLDAAAWRISPLAETRTALFDALARPEVDAFTPGAGANDFLVGSGRTLLGVDGRTWRTWDVTTHHRTASGTLPAGAQVVAAGPDGRVLALSTDDGIRLWDTARDRWTGAARPLPRASTDIAFGAGGHSYLVSDLHDNRVRLRSLTDGRLLFETQAPGASDVAPSPDDRRLVVCAPGKAPQVWDTHSHAALPGAWSGDGGLCDEDDVSVVFGSGTAAAAHRFAVVSATGVRVWDTRTGRQVAALTDPEVESAAFSADGAFLATANGTEIKVWRLSSPDTPVFRHLLSLDEQQTSGTLAWAPGHATLRYLEGGTVHSFDTTAATTSAWRTRALDATLLAPDGRTLATAERAGAHYRFVLRDTRTGHVTRTPPSVPGPASGSPLMAFGPDGRTFAYGVTASDDDQNPAQRITVWDLSRDRALTTLDLASASARPADDVVSLAVGPGGRTLYAARPTNDGRVVDEVWDTTTHRRQGVLTGLASTRLTPRADGRLLVGDHRAARLPSGRLTARNPVRGEDATIPAFTADGSRLAASDLAGRVTLWDGDLRHRTGALSDAFPNSPSDNGDTVSALALSPDGRTLAVGGDKGTLQLWDTETRQPLGGPLRTPGEAIDTLAFADDNRTLYAGGVHVPLQRYAVAPAQVLREVCARAGGDLTRAQWTTYAPGTAYRRTCGWSRTSQVAEKVLRGSLTAPGLDRAGPGRLSPPRFLGEAAAGPSAAEKDWKPAYAGGMNNRADIGAFLKSRRDRITPEQAGLPVSGIRRVSGLRRSEVAVLAGVSVEYYTRLERGNLGGVSDTVLNALTKALRLDDTERAHLYALARAANTAPPPVRRRSTTRPNVRPGIRRIVDGMPGMPAFVRNNRFDILASNPLWRALYSEMCADPTSGANTARFVFLSPAARRFYAEWEDVARRAVGALRVEAGRDPHDRELSDLIGELSAGSDAFRVLWGAHDVHVFQEGAKHFRHPLVGDLELDHESMRLPDDTGLTMTVYTAAPCSTAEAGLRLLASRSATPEGAQDAEVDSGI